MPRLPRVELAGYHHILNRGVEKRKVFLDEEDFTVFLDLLCLNATLYEVTLHSYCLMSNHYHLLIETKEENLSKFMRAINSQYASYFNKKRKRVGHLWQGRFKSWFVTDEVYLYTLVKYIEFNPLKAKITQEVGAYLYSSARNFLFKEDESIKCLKNSIMFVEFKNLTDRVEFFESSYDESILNDVAKGSKLVVSSVTKKKFSIEKLKKLLASFENKIERNEKIMKAIKQGYSQYQISDVLNLSQGAVSHVVKSSRAK